MAFLLVTRRVYSQWLVSYWSHAGHILSVWSPIGHTRRQLDQSIEGNFLRVEANAQNRERIGTEREEAIRKKKEQAVLQFRYDYIYNP